MNGLVYGTHSTMWRAIDLRMMMVLVAGAATIVALLMHLYEVHLCRMIAMRDKREDGMVDDSLYWMAPRIWEKRRWLKRVRAASPCQTTHDLVDRGLRCEWIYLALWAVSIVFFGVSAVVAS